MHCRMLFILSMSIVYLRFADFLSKCGWKLTRIQEVLPRAGVVTPLGAVSEVLCENFREGGVVLAAKIEQAHNLSICCHCFLGSFSFAHSVSLSSERSSSCNLRPGLRACIPYSLSMFSRKISPRTRGEGRHGCIVLVENGAESKSTV